jgi:mono/diheme cytochrome c family protein
MRALVLAVETGGGEGAATTGETVLSAQQVIGIVIALALAIGWGLYLLTNMRRARAEVGSELELAPNRKPYLDDEQLEGPRLERALTWGLVSLAIIGVGLPLYWLAEPGRQAGAIDDMREQREGVTYVHGEGSEPVGGGALFAATEQGGFNCAGCHGGMAAIGGEVPATLTEPDGTLRQVQWFAPPLNDVTLRMTDEQLFDVLNYGRPFSPMPAWGIDGGGPMTTQQLENLILYMHSIALTPEEARAQNDAELAAEQERIGGLEDELERLEAELEGAEGDDATDLERRIAALEAEIGYDQPDTEGAALFNLHCARCHTAGWSYNEPEEPGSGAFGPPMYNVVRQFPDREDHIDFVANGREVGEVYGEQGQASGRMPYFSQILTPEQIEAIVDYERELAEERRDDPEGLRDEVDEDGAPEDDGPGGPRLGPEGPGPGSATEPLDEEDATVQEGNGQ